MKLIVKIDLEKDFHLFKRLNFVVMTINNLQNPFVAGPSKNETIWNGNKDFQYLLILCELHFKEYSKYKHVEKCRNNLETFTDALFVLEDIIPNKIQRIILI